eukprot:3701971-Rhodomonas_salina.1
MPGTGIASGAMLCPVLTYRMVLFQSMPGTGILHDAIRCPVLTYRTVLFQSPRKCLAAGSIPYRPTHLLRDVRY